jgi:hypothetical protein
MLDSWWVNGNGETIPTPQTLEQAKEHKPARSRAKVLVLHTSLSDEWIPIRSLEQLVELNSYDPERAKRLEKEAEEERRRVADELEQFQKELPTEIETLMDTRGMLIKPSPGQIQKILIEAKKIAEQNKFLEHEEIVKKACPECFDPTALQDPDLYEEALGVLDVFEGAEGSLYSSDSRFLDISEVLFPPTPSQLVAVLKTFKDGWESRTESCDDECLGNRKLAKRIAKLFPELVRDTPEARQFFNPKATDPKSIPKSFIPRSNPKPASRSKARQKQNGKAGFGCLIILIIAAAIIYSWMKN